MSHPGTSAPRGGHINRRAMLQLGGLSVFGMSLPRLLAAEETRPARNDISIILLWMGGGPANMDTFDMKPEAPAEYRGDFRPIGTKVPGLQICEHLPKMAQWMDKVCLLRSVSHPSTVHGQADHYVLTGYHSVPPIPTENISATVYPSYGAVLAREKGWQNGMPPYVYLTGEAGPYFGAGYMGSAWNPLTILSDPNEKTFQIADVSIPESVGDARTARRRSMLAELDQWQRQVDGQRNMVTDRSQFYTQAYDLMTSPAAKRAFKLHEEPDTLRDRYGRTRLGQSALLARRLVESGVRFVVVQDGRWDTHQNNFQQLKSPLLPETDQYWSALLQDLGDRGMLDTTLVIWMGEFGRTPQVNGQGGRDHWGRSNAICLSGAGINMGSVVGQTDKYCSDPLGTMHSTHDFAATIYHLLGIDGHKEYLGPDGRPHLINYHGKPIREALA